MGRPLPCVQLVAHVKHCCCTFILRRKNKQKNWKRAVVSAAEATDAQKEEPLRRTIIHSLSLSKCKLQCHSTLARGWVGRQLRQPSRSAQRVDTSEPGRRWSFLFASEGNAAGQCQLWTHTLPTQDLHCRC